MPGQGEIPIQVRRFRGVNVAVDPVFLDDADLTASENFAPFDLTGLLTKRRGTGTILTIVLGGINRVDAIKRTYDQASPPNRLLFAAVTLNAADRLYVSTNDGAFTQVTGGNALSANQRYGMAVLGNNLYLGNGTDPLKVVSLAAPTTATDLAALATLTETGQNAVAASATSPALSLAAGTYSYAWAVYDPSTHKYVSRGVARTISLGPNNWITFTAPSGALSGSQVYRLFVAPANQPIEFATLQFADGFPAAGSRTLDIVAVGTAALPVAATVARTGRFLVAHRSTLFIAGDQANKSRLYQTGVIVPGLEQDLFNQGDFFPALASANIALNDGDEITGIGILALTSTQQSPSAPLAIFKNASTWLLQGNLFDSTGIVTQLSARIGCLAHQTIVNTPAGLIFCGHDSVYLLPTDLREPLDIGWPIRPVIQAIPNGVANQCFALIHNGFYKLWVVPAGGSGPTQQWWLDLHRGVVDDPPSWWGPQTHPTVAYTSGTASVRETTEPDRGWAAYRVTGIGIVAPQDAAGVYLDPDGSVIVSRMTTKAFDGGNPFERKMFTGMRAIARSGGPTSLNPTVLYDSGMSSTPPGLTVGAASTAVWDESWDETWGSSLFAEGDTRLSDPIDRQPHLTAQVTLAHSDPVQVDLRDFELRYLPVQRAVG